MRKALLIFIILFGIFLIAGCAEKADESNEGAVEEGAISAGEFPEEESV